MTEEIGLGVFTDGLADRPLAEALDWLAEELPEVRDLEIGTGGYSPARHCSENDLAELEARGYRIAALNASGNPLEVPSHDRALRDTIRLAAEHGVGRVVCMSGGDPKLSGGGWFPGLEDETERYWRDRVLSYWGEFVAFAHAEHPGLRICLELEPGNAVFNVSTFERLAELGDNLAVNLDPSHFFWQSIDPCAVVRHLGRRIGFAHGKDTLVVAERVPLNGVLDRTVWRFTTVGRGHDVSWWRGFLGELSRAGYDGVVSIEPEDPEVAPTQCIAESARALARALA